MRTEGRSPRLIPTRPLALLLQIRVAFRKYASSPNMFIPFSRACRILLAAGCHHNHGIHNPAPSDRHSLLTNLPTNTFGHNHSPVISSQTARLYLFKTLSYNPQSPVLAKPQSHCWIVILVARIVAFYNHQLKEKVSKSKAVFESVH